MSKRIVITVLGALLAALPGCGSSGAAGAGHASIASITRPLSALSGSAFTITGSNFSNLAGHRVTVYFTATSGTPFEGGTSDTVRVRGTITSDTTITGMSPPALLSGRGTARVRVQFASGLIAEAPEPIALFEAPRIWDLGRWNQADWGS